MIHLESPNCPIGILGLTCYMLIVVVWILALTTLMPSPHHLMNEVLHKLKEN
jgi:hypothetical protein